MTITVYPARTTLKARDRLAAVSEVIRLNGGTVPTHRELLRRLRQAGVATSKGTILNDLVTLGYSNAKSARIPKHISLTPA